MAEKFTEFILALAEDPGKLAQFREDSAAAMDAAELSAAEQAIVLSGNASVIRQAITTDISADELESEMAGSVWPITVLVAVTVAVLIAETES